MAATLSTPAAAPALAPAAALLDVQAVAELLTCSPQHVRRLTDAGKMPRPVRLGSLLRWRRADIDAWLNGGCQPCRDRGARP